MTRVEIPAYTDHWMRGDRYGDVVKVTTRRVMVRTRTEVDRLEAQEIAHVKLDKSGKVVRVILDDCTVV